MTVLGCHDSPIVILEDTMKLQTIYRATLDEGERFTVLANGKGSNWRPVRLLVDMIEIHESRPDEIRLGGVNTKTGVYARRWAPGGQLPEPVLAKLTELIGATA